MREKLSTIYRNELETFGLPYAEVCGNGDERRNCALKAVKKVL